MLSPSPVYNHFIRLFHSNRLSPSISCPSFTHIDNNNNPSMVDVSNKPETIRKATARAKVFLPSTVAALINNKQKEISTAKGPVFSTAIIAGTMGVKSTSSLIPFCHPLLIDSIKFNIEIEEEKAMNGCTIIIDCNVKMNGRTGVEMEALTGVTIASLTIYDMCKALSHNIIIKDIQLLHKEGGKSGVFHSNPI
jgi:cyclic pyranopterin phosphate synthase